ncbi:hypothetical protein L2E82_15897 [Cichorium intybus]|uniref:Uncharacterized protein n=1 Tax=Cichorium intybus TaxID=13427 RepID=A0ACB9F592_CICIN|nr:hypothetical protein L1887_35246 [Cichorium endivia]KAI3765851.1 hypothetical protein L2E82_15897 [Cichorium intybus]
MRVLKTKLDSSILCFFGLSLFPVLDPPTPTVPNPLDSSSRHFSPPPPHTLTERYKQPPPSSSSFAFFSSSLLSLSKIADRTCSCRSELHIYLSTVF